MPIATHASTILNEFEQAQTALVGKAVIQGQGYTTPLRVGPFGGCSL